MVAVFAPERRGGTSEIAVSDTAAHTNRSAGQALLETVLQPVAVAVDGHDIAVVEEAVKDSGGEDFVAEDLAPLAEVLFEVRMIEPFS